MALKHGQRIGRTGPHAHHGTRMPADAPDASALPAPDPVTVTVTRGPAPRAGDQDRRRQVTFTVPGAWSTDDIAHMCRLLESSPLSLDAAAEYAARRATEIARLLCLLDERSATRTVVEQAQTISATGQYRKLLEQLRVTERTTDDEEEL